MIYGSENLLFGELYKQLPAGGCFIEIGSRDGQDHCFDLAIKDKTVVA